MKTQFVSGDKGVSSADALAAEVLSPADPQFAKIVELVWDTRLEVISSLASRLLSLGQPQAAAALLAMAEELDIVPRPEPGPAS